MNTKSLIFVLLALGHKMSHITPNSGLKKKIRERDFWDKKTLVNLQLIEDCKIALGGAGVVTSHGSEVEEKQVKVWLAEVDCGVCRGDGWTVMQGAVGCRGGLSSRVQGWAEQEEARLRIIKGSPLLEIHPYYATPNNLLIKPN